MPSRSSSWMRSRSGSRRIGVVVATLLAVACGAGSEDEASGPAVVVPPSSTGSDAGGDAASGDTPDSSVFDAEPGDAADAADVTAPTKPYSCTAAPKQCEVSCETPACTLLCNVGSAEDCRWDCPAPSCACTSTPTAACDLHEPKADCDVKCEKPECAVYCPLCTTEPCKPCETVCNTPHCVTHCQAPKVIPLDGGHIVAHCQPPKPSCAGSCEEPVCTWKRMPACPAGVDPCPPVETYEPECAPPKCNTSCQPLADAPCQIRGCEEECTPLTNCTQVCDRPTCAVDAKTGAVVCDGPTGCTQKCEGGECHVTQCF